MIKNFGIYREVTQETMDGLSRISNLYDTSVQISGYRFSPVGMSGVQTIAYEIGEEIPKLDGHIFSPAGGGGLTLALAKGFRKWEETHPGFKMPRLHCVQPEGNNTIAGPLRNGLVAAQAISKSLTSISGLQVPNIIDGDEVIAACRSTGGNGFMVTDDLIYECQENLANKEGIFCEPAGAVALAGLIQALKFNEVGKKNHVICIITGHGFKDPNSAERIAKKAKGHYFNNTAETLGYIESQIKNAS